jgi:hypothetical protein
LDFLGFLEGVKDFLEFLNNKRIFPPSFTAGRTGSPDPSCGRGAPWPSAWPAICVAGRTGSWGSFCGHARMWALVCKGSRAFPPRVRGVLDKMPETAAVRRRLAGGEGRSAGPTYDRSEGEV